MTTGRTAGTRYEWLITRGQGDRQNGPELLELPVFDPHEHYELETGPVHQYDAAPETAADIKNVGWTLGNDCPYRCAHCYSMNARLKGRDMSVPMIDRMIEQLAINGIETVNLGGNEPLFTNGPNPKNTLLPYIITSLHDAAIEVGLTTSGITLLRLHRDHRDAFELLNDVDVSFDSPFPEEHNRNRGAPIYKQAVAALEICRIAGMPHTCIMCAMSWNFSPRHIDGLVDLALAHDANVRINTIKPVQPEHMNVALSPDEFYGGFSRLLARCDPVDLGEPPLAAVTDYRQARRCPCGRTSFRIGVATRWETSGTWPRRSTRTGSGIPDCLGPSCVTPIARWGRRSEKRSAVTRTRRRSSSFATAPRSSHGG